MRERHALRRSLLAASVCIAAAAPGHAQEDSAERNFRVRLGERLTEEANLYRLPDGIDPAELLGPGVRRDDRIASTFVGVDGRWLQGSQEVALDALVSAHRFAANGDLDNTSGTADLAWNWRVGSRWSGQAGGRRERTLASFANNTSLVRDLVDTSTVRGAVRLHVGPRWRAALTARDGETAHEEPARRGDDRRLQAAAAALSYHSPRGNELGFEYAGEQAAFSSAAAQADAGTPSDYEQRSARVLLSYAPSIKIGITGAAGHTERRYPHAADSDFSGGVWNVALRWSPTDKTRIELERWRDLRAHVDAESDHFVSTGTGLMAAWSPRATIALALRVEQERHRYIGATIAAPDAAARLDEPRSAALSLSLAPLERVSLDVTYRRETRGSNRFRFDYDAEALSVGCEIKL